MASALRIAPHLRSLRVALMAVCISQSAMAELPPVAMGDARRLSDAFVAVADKVGEAVNARNRVVLFLLNRGGDLSFAAIRLGD